MKRFIHTSDLHGDFKKWLPTIMKEKPDFWIDTGDFYPTFDLADGMSVSDWKSKDLQYQKDWASQWPDLAGDLEALGIQVISIPGNHDRIPQLEVIGGMVINEPMEIKGVRFQTIYGVPWISGMWEHEVTSWRFPELDCDILLSHAPPWGILNIPSYGGIAGLANWISYAEKPPKYHLFGHHHGTRGIRKEPMTTFINSATMLTRFTLP